MKILFICSHDYDRVSGGGSQCTNRNYRSLCDSLGAPNVDVIQLATRLNRNFSSILARCRNYIQGYNAGLSKKELTGILQVAPKYDYIFIDSSNYGVLCSYLKKSTYRGKVISFFHNVEHKMFLQKVRENPLRFWRSFIIYHNEKKSVAYSDQLIVLNERDLKDLERIYKQAVRSKSHIIPISFEDQYPTPYITPVEKTSTPPVCLFVGDDWYANIHGITWFVQEVLPHVDIKLQIAGRASDVLKKNTSHPNIAYLGFVPDLSSVIMDADFILAPIFKGGGMKVKICEALMYGKNIIGTREAFNGYDIDLRKSGAVCDTREEYIRVLNECSSSSKEKFNSYNRKRFLKKYSFPATLGKFHTVLELSGTPEYVMTNQI